ncbi:MAG: hypothetical protein E6Q90_13150 [Actinobacteria bacterium]|nr:MAG: hypothetical protein E6Q90_13150 [Actinomycetota bacterium]
MPLLCHLEDPDDPVFVMTQSPDHDRDVARACDLNGIAVGLGLPDIPLTVIVARSGLPEPLITAVRRDRPLLIVEGALEIPAGYDVVEDSDVTVLAPAHLVQSAQEAIAGARALRARPAPVWLNAGTDAAMRLLAQERSEAESREAALQSRTRRAYDQMRSARDQMIRLRMRKHR